MANYKYQDYMELKNLFRSYLNDEEIELSQELKQFFWRELKRLQREAQSPEADGGEHNARQVKALLSLEQQMELGYMPEDPLNVEMLVETAELFDALYAAISQLDERSRLIVEMYSEGYTEREIAVAVGAWQRSIKNWKKSALAELRVILVDYR